MTAQFSNSNGGIARSALPSTADHARRSPAVHAIVLVLLHLANVAQPLRHDAAGRRGNVDADPLTFKILRRNKRRAAAAERVEHDVVLVAAALMIRSSSASGFCVG